MRAGTWMYALLAAGMSVGCHEDYAVGKATAEQVEVESFTLSGVEAVDEAALRDVLATRESPSLPWSAKRYFDRDAFGQDLERIKAYYHTHGYPDAHVTSYDVDVNDMENTVRLHVAVAEGEPRRVRGVELFGFDVLQPDRVQELRRTLPVQLGEPVVKRQVIESGELASSALKNAGYPWARVTADTATRSDGAVVVLQAQPGELAIFGQIDVAGNTSVTDEVIRRQLLFRPGERYRQSEIRESLRRLYALELFEFVNIEPANVEPGAGELPTRVTVTEGDHRRLEFSLGYGTEEKARGDVSWRHVNFFGGARSLDVHGKVSWLDRGVEATFVQPYFFAPELSLGLQGQTWFLDEAAFDSRTQGGRATITHALGPEASAAAHFSYTYQRSAIAPEALGDPDLRDELIALGLNPDTGEQDGVLSTIGLTAQLSRVDDRLNPTTGYFLSGGLEQAGGWLPGTYHYLSATAEARGYYTPHERVTMAARARYGGIDPFGPASNIPFFKRFFLGGATSLRGWGRYQVSPLSSGGLPVGGQTLLETSAEVRARVWGNLGAVAFVDVGNVWPEPWRASAGDLLYDAGPGIRYLTPIGPVRLDFAYQINRLEGLRLDGELQDRRWRLHFSIGQAF